MSRMEGRGGTDDFAAVFTVRWRVLRSAAQSFPYPDSDAAGQHALNVTPLEVVRWVEERLALFSGGESVGAVVLLGD